MHFHKRCLLRKVVLTSRFQQATLYKSELFFPVIPVYVEITKYIQDTLCLKGITKEF